MNNPTRPTSEDGIREWLSAHAIFPDKISRRSAAHRYAGCFKISTRFDQDTWLAVITHALRGSGLSVVGHEPATPTWNALSASVSTPFYSVFVR